MVHDLKLYGENFESMKLGNKIREYRLYDEKRRLIKVGDIIRFVRLPNKDEFLYANVTKIEVFDNWYLCYEKYFEEDFKKRYSTIQDVVDDTFAGGYYTKEETEQYGCCCITLAKIRKCK